MRNRHKSAAERLGTLLGETQSRNMERLLSVEKRLTTLEAIVQAISEKLGPGSLANGQTGKDNLRGPDGLLINGFW